MDVILLRGCLAQSGTPIAFQAVGGGTMRIDVDDSQVAGLAALLAFRDTALLISIEPDPDGTLIQRRGRPKKVADE